MNLTPHFTLEELSFSSTALRLGIDNTPPEWAKAHLLLLAQGLEAVRAILRGPMHVDSGWRCTILNAAVKGAYNSAHTQGFAADFTCREFGPPLAVVRAISSSPILFDQLICEGTWTHISFAPTLRRQVLTAHFSPGGTTYTQGVANA